MKKSTWKTVLRGLKALPFREDLKWVVSLDSEKQISIFNDRSTDRSKEIIEKWITRFRDRGWGCVYSDNPSPTGGCGYAKNKAIQQSHGEYLCFQDADDIMYPDRITKELEVLKQHPDSIVGTRFESTLR